MKKPRTRWSVPRLESELRPIIEQLGRMPTAPELQRSGRGDIAACLSHGNYGGHYAEWAARLGVGRSGGCTHRGQEIEAEIAAYLQERGFSVERQTAIAPFDLLVDGAVRVDVKSAKHSSYRTPRGKVCAGFFFGLSKREPTCDVYVLCGVDAANQILFRFFVPAEAARVSTLTLTPRGKYRAYAEALHVLSDAVSIRRVA